MRGTDACRRLLPASALALTLALLGASASTASPAEYAIEKIGPSRPALSFAVGVNDRGQAIVSVPGLSASDPPDFVWTAGHIERIQGRVAAINANGAVVGVNPQKHAFLWRHGGMTDLGTLGGWRSFATAISDAGHVVGWSVTGGPRGVVHAFVYRNGKMTDLGKLLPPGWVSVASDVNERGQVVGKARPPTTQSFRAFLWQGGKAIDLGTLGGKESEAVAINDRGQIAGWSWTGSGFFVDHAFLWQRGKMTDLGTLGGETSEATAINARGQVVGFTETKRSREVAFLWDKGAMVNLGAAKLTGGDPETRVIINDRAQIVGYANDGTWFWERGQRSSLPALRGAASDTAPAAINNRGVIAGWSNYYAVVWTRER